MRILPRWLDAAVSYRSAIDVDLSSPVAKGTLPLPHALAFAVASHPLAGLTLDADVRLTLWQDTRAVAFTFSDMTTPKETLALDYADTVGVRVGATWHFLRDGDGEPRLAARLGVGWEQATYQRRRHLAAAPGRRSRPRLGAASARASASSPSTPAIWPPSRASYSAPAAPSSPATTPSPTPSPSRSPSASPTSPGTLDEPDFRR